MTTWKSWKHKFLALVEAPLIQTEKSYHAPVTKLLRSPGIDGNDEPSVTPQVVAFYASSHQFHIVPPRSGISWLWFSCSNFAISKYIKIYQIAQWLVFRIMNDLCGCFLCGATMCLAHCSCWSMLLCQHMETRKHLCFCVLCAALYHNNWNLSQPAKQIH